MEFLITINGDELVEKKFEQMGVAALKARRAMMKIALLLLELEEATFESEGQRTSTPWAPASEEWLQRKMRERLDPRTLHASLALRDSMSHLASPDQILAITDRSVSLGSSLPYAAKQNVSRPFDRITEGDKFEMRAIVSDHLTKVWKAERV